MIKNLQSNIIQILMFPFQNSFSQYIADQYHSAPYYQSLFHSSSQQHSWNPINYNQPPIYYSHISHPQIQNQVKNQHSTKTKERTRKTKEKVGKQSSSQCHSEEQESEETPGLKNRQKYGRNINSNIFHQMLKAIRCQQLFDKFLDKIFEKQQSFELTKKKFFQLLVKKTAKIKPYVSNKKISLFLHGLLKQKIKCRKSKPNSNIDIQFFMVLRIVCRYYLSNIHLLNVFNKLKLQKQSINYHINGMRIILGLITK